MARPDGSLPPVILLGGSCNALSVARSLGRAGVKVFALTSPDAPVRHSRYCTMLEVPGGKDVSAWGPYLLGPESDHLRGAVVLACSDAELEYIAHNRERLAAKYLLDLSEPSAQLAMLNKLTTYQKAQAAGIPLPGFWTPKNRTELDALRDVLPYPLLVKPLYSHVYRKQFRHKLMVAHNFEDVVKGFDSARVAGVEVMLVEMIPGPDDRLCSAYTYLDENGQPLFHFTKRIVRRYPLVMGNGCCHLTDWNPEVSELAVRFFQAVGLRGLCNAEFKRDERDGRLKLIECNARFTEANCLVLASGLNLPLMVYNRLVGRPLPPLDAYRKGMRLWHPLEDFRAYRQLRGQGILTFRGWLKTVARPRILPFFRWSDPMPSLVALTRRVKESIGERLRRLVGRK